jgi:4-hydroxyproline epimerase
MFEDLHRLHVIDSHTGGEPTRIIVAGGPDLGAGSMADRRGRFQASHDFLRKALVTEPRGSAATVGGILCDPVQASSATGIIFFNNVGYLGMCVHGTIGLVTTLAYMGKIGVGEHRFETPVGLVTATLHKSGEVSVVNVPSRRCASNVAVEVPGYGLVHGDVAWAGNWFFLVNDNPLELSVSNIAALTDFTWAIRGALNENEILGSDGQEIDHIELYGASALAGVHSKNFVLCPGKEYDRSPCGTGTSAKLACLYAEGKLKPGDIWRQESIVGSVFEGTVHIKNGQIYPEITGSAFVTSEADVVIDPQDPFRYGLSG